MDSGNAKARISVVINTLNEERNLPFALRSVCRWASEIIVIDMCSTDRTVEIAKQFGAKVHLHEGPGFSYPPREYAIRQANEPWILVLDADEIIPVCLSERLKDLAQENQADVVLIPRLNYLIGKPMWHTGWGPAQDMQVRFFKKDMILASSTAHRDFAPKAGAKTVNIPFDGQNAIVHFNYLDLVDFIDRLNRYTSIEARQAIDRGERPNWFRAILHGTLEFGKRYLWRQGYKDGWRGFYLSLFMVFYRIATHAKMAELRSTSDRQAISSAYQTEAERLVSSYAEAR